MIPYGYKQTEVGVIPEDWTVDTIGAVTLSVTNGGNYKNSTQISLYPLIKMGNISRGYINLKKIEYVIDFPPSENDRLTYGDVLLNTRNTPELVGKVAIWKNELSRAYFNSNLLRFNFKLEKSDPFFMNLIFNTEQVISEFRNIAKGTTSVAAIYPQDMLKVKIIIPPLQEQQRIAEALSDVDGMISSLEKLVAKYKSIKTACLQQMFPQNGETVPRMRLPGFTGAWEQRKVSDLAEKTYGGGTPTTSNEAYWNGDIPWIQSSDVVDGKLFGVEPRKRITQDGLNNSAAQLIPENSIAIITRVGVGKLAFMPFSYATSQDFLSLSKLHTEPLFTVYACYKKLQSELNAVQGTSIKGITKDELLAKSIMVPQYAEQQQIGAFFKHLDYLITLHQRKLEKVQKIKQGMMQQLLTGKIRLV